MMTARARAASLVALLLFATLAFACSSGPSTSLPGRIVFVSDASGDYEIWIMNADGSDLQQLTNMPRFNNAPSLSPDGRRAVFTSWSDEGGSAIFVMDDDGGNVKQILDPGLGASPRFMPDGSIHYSRGDVLMRIDPDGGEDQVGIIGIAPAVSPDGSVWAYTKNAMFPHGVAYEARLSKPGADDWIVLSKGWDYGWVAEWSPDGQRILLSCVKEYPDYVPPEGNGPRPRDPRGICTVNADGTGLTKIIESGSNRPPSSPSWSPDGNWIAFENGEIYVARADGSGVRRVTHCDCHVSQPDWGK